MAKVYIDKNYIKELFADRVLTEAKSIILEEVTREVKNANRNLIKEFLQNKITQEIKSGPNANNISNTLGGEGNLFSFLGFEKADDPVSVIANFLTNSIKITSIKINKNSYSVLVNIQTPSIEDLREISQLPWINKSWIDAIEKGISGLGQYLYSEFGFETSRSSTGIQANKKIRSGSMRPQEYMTKIFESITDKLIEGIKG